MKQLTIRTKITLWYLLLSVVLLAVLVPLVYSTVANSLSRTLAANLQMKASQVVTATDEQNGRFIIDEEDLDLGANDLLLVTTTDGTLVYDSGGAGWLSAATESGPLTDSEGVRWEAEMQRFEVNETELLVICARPLAYVEQSLHDLRLLLLLLVPGYFVLAACGAWLLARRALVPVRRISQIAQSTRAGDLSRRITGITTNDEVGELAQTFNEMLAALEVSFARERQFTSDASHELRTPVSVIAACAEDALENSSSAQDNLETIQRETTRMTRVIAQLLMLSRGYEGRYQFSRDLVDLHEVAASVSEELAGQAQTHTIAIHNDVPPGLLLACDQSLITQLCLNLVTNAIKYGRTGGNVWLSADDNGGVVNLSVADDGIGIAESDLPHIFERFYRADKARDRSGSGLGLAIVRWIVESHGGEINVQSVLGHGTLFTITLPRA